MNVEYVTATGCEVNHALMGDAVMLAIDDQFGRIAWRLKPGLAASMSDLLKHHAQSLPDNKKRPN